STALAIANHSVREPNPVTHRLIFYGKILAALPRRIHGWLFPIHRIGPDPILNFILPRARFAPVDADRVYVVILAQINNDPLRMQRVVFVRESLRQVGIALPE